MYFFAGMYCSKTCNGLFWHHTRIQHSENSYLLKQEMQYQDYKSLLTHRKLELNLANAYLSTKGRVPSLKLGAANSHLLCGCKLKTLLHLIFILGKIEIWPRILREGLKLSQYTRL